MHGPMEIVEFGRLTRQQRIDLEGDEDDPFDAAGAQLEYRAKHRHVALKNDLGRLVASTGIVVVEVEVGEQTLDVVGLGGVIVNARHRGRGYARQVLQASLARAQTLGPRFAMLFCHRDRAGLYRRLGFAQIHSTVLVRQPGGYQQMTQQTMWRALTAGDHWPSGRVIVHSQPF